MTSRRVFIVILGIFIALAVLKRSCAEVKELAFEKALLYTQDLFYRNAKGEHSDVWMRVDTISSLLSEGMPKRVVLCLNSKDIDEISDISFEKLHNAKGLLVITNFKDTIRARQFSDRYLETEIVFLNFTAWPMQGDASAGNVAFHLDSSGQVNNAIRVGYDDLDRIQALIDKL